MEITPIPKRIFNIYLTLVLALILTSFVTKIYNLLLVASGISCLVFIIAIIRHRVLTKHSHDINKGGQG